MYFENRSSRRPASELPKQGTLRAVGAAGSLTSVSKLLEGSQSARKFATRISESKNKKVED